MDDERIVERLATSLGLRREGVCCVSRKKNGGRFYGVALLFPRECSITSHHLAGAINDALNIEAGLGNEALLDLFGARHLRFSKEFGWLQKLYAMYRPDSVDKKYAHLNKALAFSLEPAELQEWSPGKEEGGVLIITSCCRDGSPLFESKHDISRAAAIVSVVERDEERLRSIVRHALPSHHLLAGPSRPSRMPRRVLDARHGVFSYPAVVMTPETPCVEISV